MLKRQTKNYTPSYIIYISVHQSEVKGREVNIITSAWTGFPGLFPHVTQSAHKLAPTHPHTHTRKQPCTHRLFFPALLLFFRFGWCCSLTHSHKQTQTEAYKREVFPQTMYPLTRPRVSSMVFPQSGIHLHYHLHYKNMQIRTQFSLLQMKLLNNAVHCLCTSLKTWAK